MTVKAKRAKALPLLDTATDRAIGELVDESISADAEALIQGFDGQFGGDFQAWFCSRIGAFRATHELPATHEERRTVMRASRALHEALLRLANLSPVADGCMERCCLEMHQRPFKGPDGLLSGLETAAEKMALALEATEEKLETLLLQRGRKSSTPRDRLLADVADYMLTNSTVRITKRAAAGNASNLLAASGIDVPWGKEEVERIIRRARKGEK